MEKRLEELDEHFRVRPPRQEGSRVWYAAADPRFTVNGLPWFGENGGAFFRLPTRARGIVREAVWELGRFPSGGRVRFKTDSASLALRIQHGRAEIAMAHMCAVGMSGMDLYEGPPERMTYWASNKAIVPREPYESVYFAGLPRKLREFTLYLPTYNDLVLLEIGLESEARVEPPTPFRLPRPVVFYGTSITQGGCASRGANGYVPLLGRQLGVDVVNLGFSGNGKADLEVADLIAELDMSCLVNDCVPNLTVEDASARYAAFLERIRARHPTLPLLLLTGFRAASDHYLSPPRWEEVNKIVRQIYEQFRSRGDVHVHLLEGEEIIGLDPDHPSVDGVHLTDLGFRRLADGIEPLLRTLLGLRP